MLGITSIFGKKFYQGVSNAPCKCASCCCMSSVLLFYSLNDFDTSKAWLTMLLFLLEHSSYKLPLSWRDGACACEYIYMSTWSVATTLIAINVIEDPTLVVNKYRHRYFEWYSCVYLDACIYTCPGLWFGSKGIHKF